VSQERNQVCLYHAGTLQHFEALSQKVDEGYFSDTPKERFSRGKNKLLEPKLDKLQPLEAKGSISDDTLADFRKIKAQIIKKEKTLLEVEMRVSLDDIYKDVENNYSKVESATQSREFLSKINYELSEKRAIDLILKMAPGIKESMYGQETKKYCEKHYGLGEEHLRRVIKALERNKDFVCEKLYKDRNNINMEVFFNQLLEHDKQHQDRKQSELMRLRNDNAGSFYSVQHDQSQVKPGDQLKYENKERRLNNDSLQVGKLGSGDFAKNNDQGLLYVIDRQKEKTEEFLDFITEIIPENERENYKNDIIQLYKNLKVNNENMDEFISEIKNDRERITAWLSRDKDAIKKLIARLEPESSSPITDGIAQFEKETRNASSI
jgi:hypothetical protein